MFRNPVAVVGIVALLGSGSGRVRAASLQGDAEAASHGDEAARIEFVSETEVREPNFIFRQYNLAVLSHYSYMIGSGGEALVVDPARDAVR